MITYIIIDLGTYKIRNIPEGTKVRGDGCIIVLHKNDTRSRMSLFFHTIMDINKEGEILVYEIVEELSL